MAKLNTQERGNLSEYMEMAAEMVEARVMCGRGPWAGNRGEGDAALVRIGERAMGLRESIRVAESTPLTAVGAFGDIELALQNVEWRREISLSWLEFSRWGIQQIILISRLYYIKNPICRRLIDICALYVFGRGFEISSTDETANEVIKDFLARNVKVLGQAACTNHERRKAYDGNLFFALTPDKLDKGLTSIRLIDATEIQDIITNPDDVEEPWFYRRVWTQNVLDPTSGVQSRQSAEAWYPAMNHEPAAKLPKIQAVPINWDVVIYHRATGTVGNWRFGCPWIYPALDWMKQARKFLEACATRNAALAQFAMILTTKGGQQALQGAKQQLGTQIGPPSSLWDENPTAVDGSTFASGPGTTLKAFDTGGGPDPEKVRQYKLMACMVAGVPETFLGDVATGNLATAQSLDRPTEHVFLEKQEIWREDFLAICTYVLRVSSGAASGVLREAKGREKLRVVEARRKYLPNGYWVYEAEKQEKGAEKKRRNAENPNTIELKVTFPAIREGDQVQLMEALVAAATAGNAQGEFVGIDQKAFTRRAYEIVGIEDGDELTEAQYPEASYDPERKDEPEPEPMPQPGAVPPPQQQPKKAA